MELAHRTDLPERSEEEQVAFFDAMYAAWASAAAVAPTRVVHLDLAGTRVALAVAGDGLAEAFLPALAHLVVPATEPPRFTLHCWDSRGTGVPAPQSPCGRECFSERGDLWGMTSARIRSAFHWHEFSVNVLDMARGVGVFWVEAAAQLPYWSCAAPLRTLFHWCAEASGAQLLHAAAVGHADGAVLVTGRGGVGKSSTALACLAAGMDYVGDDYVVVRLDPTPTVHSLYTTAKLDPAQLAHFPALGALARAEPTPAGEKTVLELVPARAGQVVRARPLRAIVTPAFAADDATTVGPASRSTLQRAAAFTTLSQLPGAGRATHAVIERLMAEVPGLTLHLGRDRTRVPEAIRALLALDDAALRARARVDAGAGATAAPLVSVIIPVFNGVPFLARCIENVLAQDHAALEILVVDDGSSDDIEGAVRALPVDVRFLRQDNAGPGAARNRGIREASGDVLAFLDVDDYWPDGNLAALLERLAAHPDALVVHGAAQVVRDGPAGADVYVGGPADAFPDYIGAGLYRRAAFERVGLFDAELCYGEDSDWFTRARELATPIVVVDEVSLFVRRHERNMTRAKTVKEVNALRVLKKALDRRRAAAASGGSAP